MKFLLAEAELSTVARAIQEPNFEHEFEHQLVLEWERRSNETDEIATTKARRSTPALARSLVQRAAHAWRLVTAGIGRAG